VSSGSFRRAPSGTLTCAAVLLAALRFYDIVVFVHVAGVVVGFGVIFTYPLIVPLTRRHDARGLPTLHRIQGLIGQRIITPAGAVVLVAGLYLALSGDGGFDFADWWVGFGLLSILVIMGTGGAYFAPTERRLAELAQRDVTGAAGGPVVMSAEYEALLRRWRTVANAMCGLVLVTVLFMVLGAKGVFS
jgi:hypothetical protein